MARYAMRLAINGFSKVRCARQSQTEREGEVTAGKQEDCDTRNTRRVESYDSSSVRNRPLELEAQT